MTSPPGDYDWMIAADPRTPPQVLADIAARRWDLHPVISANPQAYPELRNWMNEVQLSAARPPYIGLPAGTPMPPPRRRSGIGWWLGGCGCLGVVALFVGIALIAGLGAATSSPVPSAPLTPVAQEEGVAEQLALFDAELAKYNALLVELEGNPVASIVAGQEFVDNAKAQAAVPNVSTFAAQGAVRLMTSLRQSLEDAITDAKTRRVNASGTLSERLVDEAGNGFIDLRWDAATSCEKADEPDRRTLGCVKGGSPLVVHLDSQVDAGGEWLTRMLVAHELAHVYQNADAARFDDHEGDADRLVEKGLFQGSREKMADCYALTYYDQWTLEYDRGVLGYGYVCTASERTAIRQWAASINAPMPR